MLMIYFSESLITLRRGVQDPQANSVIGGDNNGETQADKDSPTLPIMQKSNNCNLRSNTIELSAIKSNVVAGNNNKNKTKLRRIKLPRSASENEGSPVMSAKLITKWKQVRFAMHLPMFILPPFTSIYLHLPPFTSIYLHSPPFASSYLHLPPFDFI